MREAGAEVVTVSPDGSEALSALRTAKGLAFPTLMDPDLAVTRAYGILNEEKGDVPHPTTIVIDAAGIVRYRRTDVDHRQRPPFDEVLAALREARAE